MADGEESMEEMLTQKAHELFALCDRENKGFIGKRDMQVRTTENADVTRLIVSSMCKVSLFSECVHQKSTAETFGIDSQE